MIIRIGKRQYVINPVEHRHARRAVNNFVEAAKAGSLRSGRSTLYLTTLLLMYKKSKMLLEELGPEAIEKILQNINGDKE